jgi:hypothetical protein
MNPSLMALPLSVLSLGLAACGGGDSGDGSANGYPGEVEKTFLDACKSTSKGNESACRCTLTKLEATVPYDDFKKADAAVRAGKAADPETSGKLTSAIKACVQP